MTKIICVDANFVVKLVNSSFENSPYIILWDNWEQNQYSIIAPTLFYYEITNVFHRMSLAGQISDREAEQALQDALDLQIMFYGDRQLHQQALSIARQYKLSAAYDAHYLALAERFKADFYTGDKRLFNSVNISISWIYLVN
jgi:predicted nucleic acid-binding protein